MHASHAPVFLPQYKKSLFLGSVILQYKFIVKMKCVVIEIFMSYTSLFNADKVDE